MSANARARESDILADVLVAVTALPGALCERLNTGVFRSMDGRRVIRCGNPGAPDVRCTYHGRSIAIETKTRRGSLSPDQRRWRAAFETAGGVYILARSAEDALTALADLA